MLSPRNGLGLEQRGLVVSVHQEFCAWCLDLKIDVTLSTHFQIIALLHIPLRYYYLIRYLARAKMSRTKSLRN